MTRTRLAYWAAWLGLTAAVVVAGTIVPSARTADSAGCPDAEREPVVQTDQDLAGAPPPQGQEEFIFKADDDAKFRLRFDDSRSALKDEILLLVIADQPIPSNGLNSEQGFNAQFGGSYALRGPRRNIGVRGSGIEKSLVRFSGHEIGLCLRLDPVELKVPPGSYSGSLGVAFGSEMRASIPIEASFRAGWLKAAFLAFLGVLLGLVVKVLSEAAAIARTRGTGASEALRIYTSQLEFPVIVILAAIAGTFVYVAQYLHDPDWGAEGTDSLRLFSTCFILQMGSSEALAALSRVAGGGPPVPSGRSG